MGNVDFSNPQVYKNWMVSQAKEGRGSFSRRDNVLVFVDKYGTESILPDGVVEELEKGGVVEPAEAPEAEVEEVAPEPTPEEEVAAEEPEELEEEPEEKPAPKKKAKAKAKAKAKK